MMETIVVVMVDVLDQDTFVMEVTIVEMDLMKQIVMVCMYVYLRVQYRGYIWYRSNATSSRGSVSDH